MRRLRTACLLVFLVLILASIYWNVKTITSSVHQRTKIAGNNLDTLVTVNHPSIIEHHHALGSMVNHTLLDDAKYSLLSKKLLELEQQLNGSKLSPRVIFMGPSDVIKAESNIYKVSLKKQRYIIEDNLSHGNPFNSSQWTGLFCCHRELSKQLSECLGKQESAKLSLSHKISFIPGFYKLLYSPNHFCYTMLQTQHLKALSGSPLSLPCYVVGSNTKKDVQLDNLIKSRGNFSLFFIQTRNTMQVLLSLNKSLPDKSIVQVINEPLKWNGLPLVLKVYVLITSISPLRIYRYTNGCSLSLEASTNEVKIDGPCSIDNFGNFVSQNSNKKLMWSLIDATIVQTAMISESLLSNSDLLRSRNSFQLLEFYFTFNSTFYPYLIKLKLPDPGRTIQGVAMDTVHLVFTMTSSYMNVSQLLDQLKDIIGVKGINCKRFQHRVCFGDKELIYLLKEYRERSIHGSFKKLYPSAGSDRYQVLLHELQSSSVGMEKHQDGETLKLHNTFMLIENYVSGQSSSNLNTKTVIGLRKNPSNGNQKLTVPNAWQSKNIALLCKDDPNSMPILTRINIKPYAVLKPSFNRGITEYETSYPFSTLALRIFGNVSNCWGDVVINSQITSSKDMKFYLGVGWNKFVLHLYHHLRRSIVASYKFHIYRKSRDKPQKLFDSHTSHEVCSLKQDCDLKVYDNLSCNPQKIPANSLNEFLLKKAKILAHCESGYAPGSWVLPCGKCTDLDSCYWSKALWVPELCQHSTLTEVQAKTCLAKKKVLFVGDSTNRGMMYYLMEKINGSLLHWEKTHSMKVYSSALNDHQTSVSFAYFPQFWLPSNRKPDFIKALQHLMAKFLPLQNSTATILVVGGVQWLRPSYVTAIKTTLKSLGLSAIKVIIKTLGSGFNIPVDSFNKQDLESHINVMKRNKLLIQSALANGFDVIDTYSMTISRYKEFLKGNCGCHFHKVVNLSSHRKDFDGGQTFQRTQDKQANHIHSKYHVIGAINSAYSEILISRMCN